MSNTHEMDILFLTRDLADMALEYSSDKNCLEYISDICFNLDALQDGDTRTEFYDIFSITDSAAFSTPPGLSDNHISSLTRISRTAQLTIEQINKDKK